MKITPFAVLIVGFVLMFGIFVIAQFFELLSVIGSCDNFMVSDPSTDSFYCSLVSNIEGYIYLASFFEIFLFPAGLIMAIAAGSVIFMRRKKTVQ